MSFVSLTSDSDESQFVRADNIYEGTRHFFSHRLLAKFIVFEHNVYCSSNCSRLHQKYSSCIEIVAYASIADHSALDDKKIIEASRLYLCSKKIFKLATLLEEQKGNKIKRRSYRLEGGKHAQNLMMDYILPRIIVSKNIVNGNNNLLRVEWSPLALDCDKNAFYDEFKVLGQLPHIDNIT